VGRIISVVQVGDIASVLLELDNRADPAESRVDFYALLRVDGVWRIANQTATHNSRAELEGTTREGATRAWDMPAVDG
jgi:hypothetical protein